MPEFKNRDEYEKWKSEKLMSNLKARHRGNKENKTENGQHTKPNVNKESLKEKGLRAIEELFKGQNTITPEFMQKAVELVSQIISPITDIRATKEYRLQMIKVMLERGMQAAVARLQSKKPAYGTKFI